MNEEKDINPRPEPVIEPASVKGEILKFAGVGNKDVYNPALLQTTDGLILAGRVESRKNALDSRVMFFSCNENGVWEPIEGAPVFELEDPFFTKINGEIIFGGVQVDWDVQRNDAEPYLVSLRTMFYRGKDIYTLKQFAAGPERMKDIRLIELTDGKIGVFSRPQGGEAGKGRIGFTTIDSLEKLTPEAISSAALLDIALSEEQWIGTNALYLLADDKAGVLGHVASKDANSHLHYKAITFVHDPGTGNCSPIKVIATRGDFPGAESKEPRLYDVVFPGELVSQGENEFDLYAGVSDARVGRKTISEPFFQ